MTAIASVNVFARWVRERLFAPSRPECRRVGVEVEMLPLLADGTPCPLEASGSADRSTLRFMREYGARRGWRERRSVKGAPYFALPTGWSLTFEPGGQVELCTAATPLIGKLVAQIRCAVLDMRAAAWETGIDLTCLGIDPHNDDTAVPLQIRSERYERMSRYFESIGRSGVRMMRQTAATQVSLDGGTDPGTRWRLLADAAPYLTAIFANSPRYAGEDTGYVSFRQRCWRLLDPTRTGVPHQELAPSDGYTRFALCAVDMTRTTSAGEYRPFAEWVADGEWTRIQWENHLTTLFPEVRPRGHLEVRSIDAVPADVVATPVVLLAGLVYDEPTASEARSLLASADDAILERAARCGLHAADIARIASDLAELGLRGARRLGEDVLGLDEVERAEHFVREYTARGLSPADTR